MQILDQAIAVMRQRGADGPAVAARLDELAKIGEQAAGIWKAYVDQPGADGDKYSLVSWMGPTPVRQLFDLSLEAKKIVDMVCAAAGNESRFLVLGESPIMMAYVGLKDGQTGPQAAAEHLAAQQAMNKHFRDLAAQVRSVKPAKAGGKSTAAKPTGKTAAKAKPKSAKKAKKSAGAASGKKKAAKKKK